MSNLLPGDVDDVDFQIEKEDWNTYELKDGIRLKGRMIVLRLSKDKNAPAGQYGVQTQNIFVVYAPKDEKGPPSTPPQPNTVKQSDMIPVEVLNSNEVWNNYKILNTGDRLKVKMVVTDVYRVKNAFDNLGQPYYIITSGIMISPMPKGVGQ